MNFDLNVNVTVGVTPTLGNLLGSFLNQPTTGTVLEAPAPIAPAVAEFPVEEPQPSTYTAPAFEPLPAISEVVINGKPVQDYTKEDVENAMHQTRIRFEGDNYKNETTSERYQKYHKQLNGIFKMIAAELAQCKPTSLPAEKIPLFIGECAALNLDPENDAVILREKPQF